MIALTVFFLGGTPSPCCLLLPFVNGGNMQVAGEGLLSHVFRVVLQGLQVTHAPFLSISDPTKQPIKFHPSQHHF